MANLDLQRNRLDPMFTAADPLCTKPAPRGRGLDRRLIIVIDGRNYKPGPKEAAILAQRMTAKQIASDWFWCAVELATMAGLIAVAAGWCIAINGG